MIKHVTFFTIALKKVKGASSLTKENLYILLDSYSDIFLLDEEKTLNRYSISSELNNKIFEEFSVQKNAFLSYLKTTHLGKYVDNTAFILSINSTICSILEKENIEELLSNFCDYLMVI